MPLKNALQPQTPEEIARLRSDFKTLLAEFTQPETGPHNQLKSPPPLPKLSFLQRMLRHWR